MHELLHIIGFCPESLAHPNFLNIFIVSYQEILYLINKGYEKIKNLD